MSDAQDMRPEGAPPIDDPFLLALRYNDADCEELGLDEAIAKHGLDREVLEYAAEQRVLRLILAQKGELGQTKHGEEVDLSPADRALMMGLVPMFMDALLGGWRARAIVEADREAEDNR